MATFWFAKITIWSKTFLHRLIVYWLALFLCCCILFIPMILMLFGVAFPWLTWISMFVSNFVEAIHVSFLTYFSNANTLDLFTRYIARYIYLPCSYGTRSFFWVSEMDHSLKNVLKNISAASLMLSTVHPVDLNFLTADLFSSHFRCSASEFPLTCLSALFLDVVLQSAFLSLYLLSC